MIITSLSLTGNIPIPKMHITVGSHPLGKPARQAARHAGSGKYLATATSAPRPARCVHSAARPTDHARHLQRVTHRGRRAHIGTALRVSRHRIPRVTVRARAADGDTGRPYRAVIADGFGQRLGQEAARRLAELSWLRCEPGEKTEPRCHRGGPPEPCMAMRPRCTPERSLSGRWRAGMSGESAGAASQIFVRREMD